MSLTRPAAAVIAVLSARCLATGHLTATVAGATISVPALAVAAACVLAVTVSVACPQCKEPVSAMRQPRQASRGPLYESPGRALDRAMLAHLTGGWCEQ